MRRWILAFAAIFAITVGAVACGGGDDERTIDTGDGEVTFGGDLPDDFPDSFPVYDGADFEGGAQGNQGGVEGFVATWRTGDSAEDVTDFYDEEFADGPWKSSGSGSAGGGGYWIVENEDEGLTAYVGVTEIDGDTAITAVVGESDDLGSPDDGDDPTEPADDGSGDGDNDGDTGGSADLPDEVDLDDDFPADKVYIPGGARVTSSSNFSTGGNASYFVEIYEQSDDAESVADDYESNMESKGWTNAFTSESDGTFVHTYSNEAGTESAAVSISDSDVDGYVLITLTLNVVEE